MKRFLTLAVILGVSFPLGLTGCSDKAKVETSETVSTPSGETQTTTTQEIKSTGENPPANSAGQTAETAK